jgi:hypothetical protein
MPEPIPDPDFRPASYWDVADPVVAITASIRGELRRRLVTDLLTGEAERHGVGAWALDGFDLDADLLADDTAEGALECRCAMHPWFRGGEHLPALRPGEVEVARVVVWKADLLVVSIRARRDAEGAIRWRVVDEIGTRYCGHPRSTAAPLTALELVRFIDGLRVYGWRFITSDFVQTLRCDHMAAPESEDDLRRAARLVTVSSPFYPGIGDLYALRAVEWADACVREVQERMEQGWPGGLPEPLVTYVLERLDEG